MQRGDEGRFRPFLIHGAAAHDDLAEAGLVHERGIPRRRRPLGRIHLLDVVHEVEAEGLGRARVERREDPRLTVAGDLRDLLKSGVAEHPHRQIAAFVHPAILGGDRRLFDPFLQPLHRFIVAAVDFCEHRFEI